MAGGRRRSRMINDGHKYIVGRVGQGGQSKGFSLSWAQHRLRVLIKDSSCEALSIFPL